MSLVLTNFNFNQNANRRKKRFGVPLESSNSLKGDSTKLGNSYPTAIPGFITATMFHRFSQSSVVSDKTMHYAINIPRLKKALYVLTEIPHAFFQVQPIS